ncbi:MAG: DNA primase [Candidatus Eremiobacteraeota bacterium]|nr:DNA primase [Candidatus Eremiobacteraeota bacterium]MBC5827051.1 DNA primase [Candidatus Eremiobacteraeota bacterium]
MPFDTSVVAEIGAKVDLLTYVSQFVTLKKRGREYVGLCPFHSEKTPSFSLNAEKQVWHCYGCDAGGDLIKFVQRYENADFPTAIRMLAARAGITLGETAGAQRRRSEREAIYEANGVACDHFIANLKKSAAAREYLTSRGIEPKTAAAFGIGYAADSWDSLTCVLDRAGVDPTIAVAAGLVSPRRQGEGRFDFFRQRLMFPVYNLTGEVMAFGGRALTDEPPKYLNTPNTAAYTKGKHVYALQLARRAAAADGALIVVEGYLDAVALHQAGFANAVASLGTAFSAEQARELRRVASNVYLCFDGDAAGRSATARSVDMLVEEGLSVRVIALPEGKDPDALVREGGSQALSERIDVSVQWIDFKIAATCERIASRFATKSDIAREAMAIIAQVRDPIERDQYVKAMARRLEVSESALRGQRSSALPPRVSGEVAGAPVRRVPPATQPLSIERELLRIVLSRPSLLPEAMARVGSADFDEEPMRHAFEKLESNREELARGLNPLALFSQEETTTDLTLLALSSPPLALEEDERRLDAVLQRFARRRLERRLSTVDEEVNRLEKTGRAVPKPLREELVALASSLFGRKQTRRET